MRSAVFWVLTPCSSANIRRCFGGIYRFHLQVWTINQARYQEYADTLLVSSLLVIYCLAYYLTLKIEAICSSVTSTDFYRNIRRYNPGRFLHSHSYQNLKPDKIIIYICVIMVLGYVWCPTQTIFIYRLTPQQHELFHRL
jgi:hypothetical protein